MPTYPRIKFIPDIKNKGEIAVREGDLVTPEQDCTLVQIRSEGNLKNKAFYLSTMDNREPKIVTDSQGLTCLIFIKKKER